MLSVWYYISRTIKVTVEPAVVVCQSHVLEAFKWTYNAGSWEKRDVISFWRIGSIRFYPSWHNIKWYLHFPVHEILKAVNSL